MKYDYAVQKMPGFGYPTPYDRNEKTKRIWQVSLIEHDDMGAYVKDIHVQRDNMTYDEATSFWNELRQELTKASEQKAKNEGT
ncbi:MAG: hypothetical protein QOF62_876 [Pyrinomonadaceae bacterium]|jgi:hypothetical protein|nr:hypothetical protein [Pyrinomonadaceae bacterium]